MPTASSPERPSALVSVAALASIGAGAIHATAAGAHSEHRAAVVAFAVTAVFQIGWGVLMLVRPSRAAATLGVIGNAGEAPKVRGLTGVGQGSVLRGWSSWIRFP